MSIHEKNHFTLLIDIYDNNTRGSVNPMKQQGVTWYKLRDDVIHHSIERYACKTRLSVVK